MATTKTKTQCKQAKKTEASEWAMSTSKTIDSYSPCTILQFHYFIQLHEIKIIVPFIPISTVFSSFCGLRIHVHLKTDRLRYHQGSLNIACLGLSYHLTRFGEADACPDAPKVTSGTIQYHS